MQICPWCYVDKMEKIYPTYLEKTKRNTAKVLNNPEDFAKRLNDEYRKARKSKAKKFERLEKIPVRIYGAGDFVKEHFNFIKNLEFKFFIISKNLTTEKYYPYINKLLNLKNLTSLELSLAMLNIENYERIKHLYGQDRIKFSFTGTVEEFENIKNKGYNFDIFFNILNRKSEYEKAKRHIESCPTDIGKLKLQKACTYCNRCWRSSVTSSVNWNEFI
jgi:hypothetical protein